MNKTTITIFEKFDKRSRESLWKAKSITPLLLMGHSEPPEPHVAFAGVLDTWQIGTKRSLLQLVFTPFRQCCRIIGEIAIGEIWAPREELPKLFRLPFGPCPSFAVDSLIYSEEDALDIYAGFVSRQSGAAAMLECLRQNEYWWHPPEEVPRQPPLASDHVLTEDENRELARGLLARKFVALDVWGFYTVWREAVDDYRQAGDDAQEEDPAADIVGADDFYPLLNLLTEHCRPCRKDAPAATRSAARRNRSSKKRSQRHEP